MKTLGYDKPLYILPFDREWLMTAASVKGFIGFAVGRTDFWDPLATFLSKKISREVAVAEIARRYRKFVEIFACTRCS